MTPSSAKSTASPAGPSAAIPGPRKAARPPAEPAAPAKTPRPRKAAAKAAGPAAPAKTPRPRKAAAKAAGPAAAGQALSGGGDGEVRVLEVMMALPNPNPVIILEEVAAPKRRLAIPIGFAEGTAIAYVLRGRPTPKPLTHELFIDVVAQLGGRVVTARVTRYAEGGYFAEIVVAAPGRSFVVACRPSDAIALALRQGPEATVVVASSLLGQLGTGGGAAG
ncbi:MAG: bifunctional nuclease family protein [Acidimicrobiales bacterium]|jgi:hypothetical protein